MDLELLKQVKTVVVHENSPGSPCADGTASAILIEDALPDVRLVFGSYGRAEFEQLPAEPGILFCDITPPAGRDGEFLEAGAIVLDHHDKRRAIVERFVAAGRGAFGEVARGESGAVLAFREVWNVVKTEASVEVAHRAAEFARLAGVWDCWRQEDPAWKVAAEQRAALRFWPHDRWPTDPFGVEFDVLMEMLRVGSVLVEKQARLDVVLAREVCRVQTVRGTQVAITPTLDTSELADVVEHAAVLVGFRYRFDPVAGHLWLILSCRSRAEYDVGAFCASVPGGGGHKQAAGCQVAVGAGDPSPYALIVRLLDAWESKR